MHQQTISGVIQTGHKENALEIPFDPEREWSMQAVTFAPGRRGYPARATLNNIQFESYVVARSKRFWLLLADDVVAQAGVGAGDTVSLLLSPGTPSML